MNVIVKIEDMTKEEYARDSTTIEYDNTLTVGDKYVIHYDPKKGSFES